MFVRDCDCYIKKWC